MGTYRYSQKIGRGGMAQVYLAIQEGIGGFEKPVVVKRIFAHLCESDHFIKMFLDEARLAATVRHPNVVEIFDIGHDDEGYFMVMEYLSGETLAFVAQTLSLQKRALPAAIACRIGSSVAAGLQYAHRAVDACGKPQPLVHRDVTPSNLMVCYNGAVKILDFGIAKAIENAEETTDSAAVKGKLSYLSPEQVNNEPLDARTDVFQLGIVMHEILCGRRLFNARSNHEKITAVMEREIPAPSALNPEVPSYLDEVVLAALERDPEKRTQTADEVRAGLEDALERMGEPVSDAKLGAWLRTTFPRAHDERLDMERFAITAARNSTKVISNERRTAEQVENRFEADSRFEVEWHTPSGNGQSVSTERSGPESSIDRLLAMHAQTIAEADDPDMEPPTVAIPHESVRQAQKAAAKASSRSRFRFRYWLGAGLLAAGMAALAILFVQFRDTRAADERAAPILDPMASDPTPGAQLRAANPGPDNALAAVETQVENPGAPGVENYEITVVTVPENAIIELDGEEQAVGSMFKSLPRDGREHLLAISAPGYERLEMRFSATAPPPSVIRLRRAPGKSVRTVVPTVRSRDDVGKTADGDARSDTSPERPRTDNLDPWAQ